MTKGLPLLEGMALSEGAGKRIKPEDKPIIAPGNNYTDKVDLLARKNIHDKKKSAGNCKHTLGLFLYTDFLQKNAPKLIIYRKVCL
jgi:hypothetical protein